MSKEVFVAEVKRIVGLMRGGEPDSANTAFGELFASPLFADQRPEDRRQAFKLLVLAKRSGEAPATLIEALRAANGPLEALVEATHDPEDYEHRVEEPPTDLSLHPNSPGYRLILNNILFPAAKKKKQKT